MREIAQRTSVRVYYEDTDFSGRVYHASYIRFFERGRTEWLRELGFQHSTLARVDDAAFVVTKLQVDFVAPALIDDLLEIVTVLKGLKGPLMNFEQTATRAGAALAIAVVAVVAVRGDRPVRPPRAILEAVARLKRR